MGVHFATLVEVCAALGNGDESDIRPKGTEIDGLLNAQRPCSSRSVPYAPCYTTRARAHVSSSERAANKKARSDGSGSERGGITTYMVS